MDFVDFGWLDMLDIAYCYRWQWYIATNGGQGADKNILKPRFGPLWSNFAPKMAKIEILGHFIWSAQSACPLLTWHILSQTVLDNMQREALWGGLKSNVNSTLEVKRSKKSKGRGQPEVEQVRRTLQFSTSVEVRLGIVVRWLVGPLVNTFSGKPL